MPLLWPVVLDLKSFKNTIAGQEPPDGSSLALQALWWDAKGDWAKAHACAQERDDQEGMRVHAYLHRKEGDPSNAEYWYRRCRTSPSTLSLEDEWASLAGQFLSSSPI
jgi:hypothetical protein